jgi:hypothetical protein
VILFFFCTPVHSSAQGMIAGTDNRPFRASQHFPSPFLKGEGGVMRVLEIRVRIANMPGMLRGRVMSCPKK